MRKNRRQSVLMLITLAVLTHPLSGCQSTFGNQYGTKQEVSLGQKIADEVEKEEKVDTDPDLNARIDRIAEPIFQQARLMRGDVTYRIKILDDKDVNAFSLPGGWIYLNSGLINKAGPDDDAIAAVIGHESSHVVLRHAVKQITDSQDKGILVDILGIVTRTGDAYQAVSMVYELDQLHYSRKDEYEADKYGLMFSYNAGFDPYGMPRFFQVLADSDKTGTPAPWSVDHPITRNRIARVNALIDILKDNHGKYPTGTDDVKP